MKEEINFKALEVYAHTLKMGLKRYSISKDETLKEEISLLLKNFIKELKLIEGELLNSY